MVVDVGWVRVSWWENIVRWEEFEVDCVRLVQVGVEVVVWVAVVFNEDGFYEQRWFVLPFVVY